MALNCGIFVIQHWSDGANRRFRLRLNLATVVLLYLIDVVLLSLKGSFAASAVVSIAVVSIAAVLCLQYFFAPPIFSLRVSDPLNVVALVVFLTIALVVARLISRVRKQVGATLSSVSPQGA